jgi:predicted TIM-barrel fold metal-dependent hydrolase
MTGKELKKLSRTELLEILLHQVEENEQLRQQLEEAERQLAERAIVIEDSGSMAEAAMRLSGVFDQAQQAADDYLQSIRLANREPEAYANTVLAQAREEAEALIAEAERRSARIHAEADEYWNMMRSRVQGLLQNN